MNSQNYLKRRKEEWGCRGEETTHQESWFLSPNITSGEESASRYRYIGEEAGSNGGNPGQVNSSSGNSGQAGSQGPSSVNFHANSNADYCLVSPNRSRSSVTLFAKKVYVCDTASVARKGGVVGEEKLRIAKDGFPPLNHGYRDYSPKTACFTTVDPIRDGHNWYAYCSNDPVNFVDLWGLSAGDVKQGSVWDNYVGAGCPYPLIIRDKTRSGSKNPYEGLDSTQILGSPILSGLLTSVNGVYDYYNSANEYIKKMHNGIDIAASSGTPIYASGNGIISEKKDNIDGYGYSITIDHGYGLTTRYSHLQEKPYQKIGEKITKGSLIGKVGNTTATGASTGYHLDYEVRNNGVAVNPLLFTSDVLKYVSPKEAKGYLKTNTKGEFENWLIKE